MVPPQSLICHPATPGGFSLSITASVERLTDQPGDGWRIRYELQGDLAALLIPEPAKPGAADGLWQHTCFEAFVAQRGAAAYQEFNFSPSGQWAHYLFSAERVRDTAAESADASLISQMPSVAWHRLSEAFVLEACIPASAFHLKRSGPSLDLGLTAVIETRDHRLTYWALRHPCVKPDFHNRQGFAWQVPANMHA
ncbi:MAG: hypothetical protein C0453_05935 [Comamonadaceae bacterium]|nr:hypothetical protein [Comamonadaceae bacterium]